MNQPVRKRRPPKPSARRRVFNVPSESMFGALCVLCDKLAANSISRLCRVCLSPTSLDLFGPFRCALLSPKFSGALTPPRFSLCLTLSLAPPHPHMRQIVFGTFTFVTNAVEDDGIVVPHPEIATVCETFPAPHHGEVPETHFVNLTFPIPRTDHIAATSESASVNPEFLTVEHGNYRASISLFTDELLDSDWPFMFQESPPSTEGTLPRVVVVSDEGFSFETLHRVAKMFRQVLRLMPWEAEPSGRARVAYKDDALTFGASRERRKMLFDKFPDAGREFMLPQSSFFTLQMVARYLVSHMHEYHILLQGTYDLTNRYVGLCAKREGKERSLILSPTDVKNYVKDAAIAIAVEHNVPLSKENTDMIDQFLYSTHFFMNHSFFFFRQNFKSTTSTTAFVKFAIDLIMMATSEALHSGALTLHRDAANKRHHEGAHTRSHHRRMPLLRAGRSTDAAVQDKIAFNAVYANDHLPVTDDVVSLYMMGVDIEEASAYQMAKNSILADYGEGLSMTAASAPSSAAPSACHNASQRRSVVVGGQRPSPQLRPDAAAREVRRLHDLVADNSFCAARAAFNVLRSYYCSWKTTPVPPAPPRVTSGGLTKPEAENGTNAEAVAQITGEPIPDLVVEPADPAESAVLHSSPEATVSHAGDAPREGSDAGRTSTTDFTQSGRLDETDDMAPAVFGSYVRIGTDYLWIVVAAGTDPIHAAPQSGSLHAATSNAAVGGGGGGSALAGGATPRSFAMIWRGWLTTKDAQLTVSNAVCSQEVAMTLRVSELIAARHVFSQSSDVDAEYIFVDANVKKQLQSEVSDETDGAVGAPLVAAAPGQPAVSYGASMPLAKLYVTVENPTRHIRLAWKQLASPSVAAAPAEGAPADATGGVLRVASFFDVMEHPLFNWAAATAISQLQQLLAARQSATAAGTASITVDMGASIGRLRADAVRGSNHEQYVLMFSR